MDQTATSPLPAAGTPVPEQARPGEAFTAALPDLQRLHAELQRVLLPAMTRDGTECDFARAAWMMAKGLSFLLQAAQAPDARALELALAEVGVDAVATAARVRDLRAANLALPTLAAADHVARAAGFDLDDSLTYEFSARIEIGCDDVATDQVDVAMDGGGHITWTSQRYGALPMDGRTHLDLAAVTDALGDAYDRMLAQADQ
ncbi:hypothetical protein ACFV1N_39565 [Streptosporangium canum]|uniref:hypothetical protein n=1 Tax=Streptosporangium canum TaxID=324952 RepID=UPI0036BA5507